MNLYIKLVNQLKFAAKIYKIFETAKFFRKKIGNFVKKVYLCTENGKRTTTRHYYQAYSSAIKEWRNATRYAFAGGTKDSGAVRYQ